MKRSTQIALYIIAALTFVVLLVVSNLARRNAPVKGVTVTLDYQGGDTMVLPRQVATWVLRQMPTLLGTPVKDVNKNAVEQMMQHNPWLAATRVHVSVGGNLRVQAAQRVPVLHLFYQEREFFLDETGSYMPLCGQGGSNVLVGNGFFNVALPKVLDSLNLSQMEKTRNFRLKEMWTVAVYLRQHPDYGVLFDQMFMDEHGDIRLVPKVGNHIVLLGDAGNLDAKFHDLLAFYRDGCSKVGWDTYRQISVKYQQQVIGSR